jgi:hypothetical protein
MSLRSFDLGRKFLYEVFSQTLLACLDHSAAARPSPAEKCRELCHALGVLEPG